MASFSQNDVHNFREVFKLYCDEDEGISSQDNLFLAVSECLGAPSATYLLDNFEDFSAVILPSSVLSWQHFFQILVHINLHSGITREVSSEAVQAVSSEEPGPRVTFSRDIQQLDVVQGMSNNPSGFTSSLRHVGVVLGNFFGVTEASQHGSHDTIGWEEFTERRVEENNSAPSLVGTLTRRVSQRGGNRIAVDEAHPPSYPQIGSGITFNVEELDDSESDDNNWRTSQSPPNYLDVVPAANINSQIPSCSPDQAPDIARQPQQFAYLSVTRQNESVAPATRNPHLDLIHNKKDAWDYYQKFICAEKTLRRRMAHVDALEFFGSSGESLHQERLVSGSSASAHVQRRIKKGKKTKLQRQSTLIRNEVDSLPSFWPVCTVVITIAQVVGMIVLLPLFGIAPIDVFPQENNVVVPILNGTTPGNISFYHGVNLWIGPTASHLIQFGAKFTPCMRTDFGIRRRNAELYNPDRLGCCLNEGNIGTVPNTECGFYYEVLQNISSLSMLESENETGYQAGIFCSSNLSNFFLPNFHPCCISLTGLCKVVSFAECEARGGFYHPNEESCMQVNCLRSICGFNEVGIGEDDNGLQPTAQQFWRWFLSIFLHLGVLHLVVYMPIQLYLGIKIERTIGWLRFCIIYVLSGVGGNIISAVFVPYGVNCGVGGAVFGLLAVLFVELFQFWQIVDKAWCELVKLTCFVMFLLALGTLPYVDNFAHVGGLLFGIPSAIVFVPYITFGKWDAARKRLLLIICIPLLIVLYLAGFFTFYFIPDPSFCPWCHYFNCVPFVPEFCPEEFSNPNPVVFSL